MRFILTLEEGPPKMKILAEVAQVVEHGTENAGVDSSTLSLGTSARAGRAEVAQW